MAASAVQEEVDGKMRKVLSVLLVLTMLLAACSDKQVAQASYGVGRKLFNTEESW